MRLSQETQIDLMAYADGELDGEALARIEALIEATPEARQFVEEMRTLGECVRVAQADRRVPKSVDHIADDVMSQVARIPRVVVNNDPPAARWRRAIAAGAVGVALAAAAGWALFMQPRDMNGGAVASSTSEGAGGAAGVASAGAGATASSLRPSATSVAAMASGGVDLENVDSPRHEVSVFFVPSTANENASSVVVWVGADAPKGTGP